MKEIQLSKRGKNKGKYVALVDDDDFEYLNQFNWSILKHRKFSYVRRVISIYRKQYPILMHNEIIGRKLIDHIDGDGLNNQRSNLRLCTIQENNRNTKPRINASSKYKGVSWNKSRKKWLSSIGINRKLILLGYFTDEIEAAKKYNEAALLHFNEFANLNIIP